MRMRMRSATLSVQFEVNGGLKFGDIRDTVIDKSCPGGCVQLRGRVEINVFQVEKFILDNLFCRSVI